jgi:hypothetical protein
MNFQNELKSALVNFLDFGDASVLRSMIAVHSEIFATSYGDYPDTHRIIDFCIDNQYFRVCRQISTGEKLYLLPIDEATNGSGVPLWLVGEKLLEWAKSEADEPSDEPTDWERWR